jgi:signal transduction histidine kinase
MVRTLQSRLILSHLVPLLIVIPLIGITLIYLLETRVLLPSLSQELLGQAALVEEMTRFEPNVWSDRIQATALVDRLSSRVRARLMLFDVSGRIMASSSAADASRIGQRLGEPGLDRALLGQAFVTTGQSRSLDAEVADVFLPSMDPDGEVIGVVRLSYQLTAELQELLQFRYLVFAVLVAGLVLGAFVGSAAALDTQRPLQRTTRAIDTLAGGQAGPPVPESGPEEIRVLARSFNALTARLHALEEARDMLLANLVHELRRPLGALLSAVQALDRGADADPALRRELRDGMTTQIHRLWRLVEDLTLLRNQELGPLQLDRQSVELSQWLSEVVSFWRQAATEKGLRWEAKIPPGLPTILADPDRLGQIIDNLIANAVEYTSPPGEVAVEAGSDGNGVWIRVCDSGPGIPPEEQERVFAPFYRGTSATRFPQGMGLGLGIARDLVIAHGGQLTLESAPGSGSHFTIWLPYESPA